MKVLLLESVEADAKSWHKRYLEACKSLGLPADVAVTRAESLSEGLIYIESGDAFDIIVISPQLPGLGAHQTEALAAIRRVAPSAAVQVYAAKQSEDLSNQIAVDPFASLALKSPTNSGRDAELEALIQEAYRRGKNAINLIDRQLLPLVERVSHLEDDTENIRAELIRQMGQIRQDMQRSQDAVLLATVDIPDIQRQVKRLESSVERLIKLERDAKAIRHTVSLLSQWLGIIVRRWQWILALLASGGAVPFIIEAIAAWNGE